MYIRVDSLIKPTICVLGGSGFVGGHLVNQLVDEGYHVRVLTRHRERHRELLVLPKVEVIEANIFNPDTLHTHFLGCEVIINLVAILNERRKGDFQRVHIGLPHDIVQACVRSGARRLIHISALNADVNTGTSQYLITKGKGEDIAHAGADQGLQVTSLRPSVIFGPDDHFFNRFAALLRCSPLIFPLACPDARFAPVFVADVVKAIMTSLVKREAIGHRYELCGPRVYTLRQLVEYTTEVLRLRRHIIGLDDGLSRLQARMMGYFPGKPFSYDNYLSLQMDAVCQQKLPQIFNFARESVEAVVPLYLQHRDQRARYLEFRDKARHSY